MEASKTFHNSAGEIVDNSPMVPERWLFDFGIMQKFTGVYELKDKGKYRSRIVANNNL